MLIDVPSSLIPRTLWKISRLVLPAVIVARGPLRTHQSIDMSRTKGKRRGKRGKNAAAAAAALAAGVPLKEWLAANPPAHQAAGGRANRIHAAHVALERDGFVVLRPRGECGEYRRYEIPVDPQRDLGPSHTSIPCPYDGPIDWGAAVSEIWGHYHATLTDAASKGISAEQLTTYDPEEKLAAQFPGFQPRFGGRIDMDIPFDDDHGNHGNTSLGRAAHQLEKTVKKFLKGGVGTNEPTNTVRHIKDENGRFGLGVVVSRPGDAIQNWHQDGDSLGEDRGKTYIAFMTASRVAGKNLGFSQTALPGPLQIIKGSHKVNATPGMREGELPTQLRSEEEVTGEVGPSSSGESYLFEADEPGTICVMNYRCWHRGLENTSAHLMRPMLYMRFEVKWGDPPNGRPRIYPPDTKRKGLTPTSDDPTKKRRVTPTQLSEQQETLEPRGEVS